MLLTLLLAVLVSGCAVVLRHELDEQFGVERVRERVAEAPPGPDYYQEVKPILDRRCVVCHACYDAPCQLKLSSPEGIDRGANKTEVYEGERLLAIDPTRLFVDAENTFGWRQKSFYPVLNERAQSKEANLAGSTFYQMLLLKERHPLPAAAILPKSFDFALDRDQQCPSIEEFPDFALEHPLWGMPYGLPGLPKAEQEMLKRWVETGGMSPPREKLKTTYLKRIAIWEQFFNGEALKERLMSRYLYEHLFLAHLYFSDLPNGEFFKLVRSKTPPGQAIEIIATRRPYDPPKVETFYYRLWRERSTITAKTHLPYALNPARMKRWKELFVEPKYLVEQLPSYAPDVASNPFKAFSAIPVRSRYHFLLDEAEFTIMNFIKGPVCRGRTALNVIEDRFWVLFVNPDLPQLAMEDRFLAEQTEHLRLPSEKLSNAFLLPTWIEYSRDEKRFLEAKQNYLRKQFPKPSDLNMDLVWDGDRNNDNAALTIFRHHDAATVVRGLVGDTPETAWLLSYPLLERIYYLLVAGFDVFGNVGHQFNSRLFMDFLRMEGEYNFLLMLPPEARVQEQNYWYRDARAQVVDYISWPHEKHQGPLGISYRSKNPKEEFFELARARLGSAENQSYRLPKESSTAGKALAQLQGLNTPGIHHMPELSFLRVKSARGLEVFTLTRDSSYSNVSTPFFETDRRKPEEDRLTVVSGFLGAYPNAFFDVTEGRLSEFGKAVERLRSEKDYRALRDAFGVRRSSSEFWTFSDWLHQRYRRVRPREGGLFDFNRLENR